MRWRVTRYMKIYARQLHDVAHFNPTEITLTAVRSFWSVSALNVSKLSVY